VLCEASGLQGSGGLEHLHGRLGDVPHHRRLLVPEAEVDVEGGNPEVVHQGGVDGDGVLLARQTLSEARHPDRPRTVVPESTIEARPERRRAGRFLLTGSTDIMLLPRLSESLAGRMEILSLRPFSQGEIERRREGFVDALFASRTPRPVSGGLARRELIARVVRGGYPEILRRGSAPRRAAWFGSYLTTILQRDVRDLPFGPRLVALPVDSIWRVEATRTRKPVSRG
jgi:hypothetical protein